MGGVTAAQFCVQDRRCRAGLNLDGIPQYGPMIDTPMNRPFLMVYSAREGRRGASDVIYARSAKPYVRVDVDETLHNDFSDMVLWGGPLAGRPIFGPMTALHAIAVTRQIVREYFDQELLGRRSPLLSGAAQSTGRSRALRHRSKRAPKSGGDMRKVIYGGACSLDGFMAGPSGEIDWLHFSKDVQQIMAGSWASADTILFGRKTWEGAAKQGGGGAMKGVTGYLFSRTLTSVPEGSGVELVREEAGAFVRDLKSRAGKDIIVMSGGNLASALIDAGVVDEVGFNVHPRAARRRRAGVRRDRQARGAGTEGVPDAGRWLRVRHLPRSALRAISLAAGCIGGGAIGRTLMR